jgi:outer membrane protein OmpA-like peptidoglycan-associated protein
MEVDAGVRLFPSVAWTIDVGVGTGVLAGYGAPQVRGFVIVRYSNEREPCAAGPEDFDGFEDGDFCAELDNDADGLEDDADQCPNDPEDMDGFSDEDGCPDPDNDADGILDNDDTCPLESEDIDAYQDGDGCPEPDNDGDGIADGVDQCPMEPEDRDGYQDDDGCPEPGPGQATVTVTDTRILISERIYFDFDTSEIRSVSLPLLDQVADVIRSLPGRRRIRVEGYTDSEGDDAYNADLSYTRARAVVDYLVGRGASRDRLLYEGYGERNPVAPNDSPEGRALNRRVEFTIMPD